MTAILLTVPLRMQRIAPPIATALIALVASELGGVHVPNFNGMVPGVFFCENCQGFMLRPLDSPPRPLPTCKVLQTLTCLTGQSPAGQLEPVVLLPDLGDSKAVNL